jgi:hypothetical protein
MDTGADTTAVEIEEEPPLSSPPQPSLPEFIPARAETVGGVDPASGPDRTVIIEMVQDESGVFKAESKEEIQHGGD